MIRLRASILGGSGYTAGELIRLLLFHPKVEIIQVASASHAGQYINNAHPNLRALTSLRFCHPDDINPCDVLFLCLPHGTSIEVTERYRGIARRIINLSADFRLHSEALYEEWYGKKHSAPHLLKQVVYGLPELHREELLDASLISGTGCMATAAILGVMPLYRAGVVDYSSPLIVDAKVGSSAAGATPNAGSHHPDRSGAVRSFQLTNHRHTAELVQEIAWQIKEEYVQRIAFTATAIEMVRGVQITLHVFVKEVENERTLWQFYRDAYQKEPFIRIVKEQRGVYRYPEPKILAGSNYCDIGFELNRNHHEVVVIAALDNLMKGAAGNAVQALNCSYGWDETLGLTFPGLHPT